MKKIRLDMESLEVTSFETREAPEGRGTVCAHLTNGANTCVYHCTFDYNTCEDTCNCQETDFCSGFPGFC